MIIYLLRHQGCAAGLYFAGPLEEDPAWKACCAFALGCAEPPGLEDVTAEIFSPAALQGSLLRSDGPLVLLPTLEEVSAPGPATCPTDHTPGNWCACTNMVGLAFAEMNIEKVYGPGAFDDPRWASFSSEGVFEGEFLLEEETLGEEEA